MRSTGYLTGRQRYVEDRGFADGFNALFLSDSTPGVLRPDSVPAEFNQSEKRDTYLQAWQDGAIYAMKVKGARRGYSAI